MTLEYIDQVTFLCDNCGTGVILKIPPFSKPDQDKLLEVTKSLKCPYCEKFMGENVAKNIEVIHKHNRSTYLLKNETEKKHPNLIL